MPLRDYQAKCIKEVYAKIRSGQRKIVIKAPTGTGKTYIAHETSKHALSRGKQVSFTAPYTVLINQTVERFTEYGLSGIGVMQANHELTDPSKPIQIITPQTLARREYPSSDLVIVDECHIQYDCINNWMDKTSQIFIGLSATPFSKGMGLHWDDMVVTKSLRRCIEDGTLCNYRAYGCHDVDVSDLKTVNGDYEQGKLSQRLESPDLVGGLVETYLNSGEARQGIVFAMRVSHANYIANEYEKHGVSAEVITAKTPFEERERIFKRYADGITKMLVSVGCLIAGFDGYVELLQIACRTKSPIKFLQMIGRGLRQSDGKEDLIIFDHAGTFTDGNLGYPEDVDDAYTSAGLDCGKRSVSSSTQKEIKEKLEPVLKCPKCKRIKREGERTCISCGFTPRSGEDVVCDSRRKLTLLDRCKKNKINKQDKQQIYSELLGYKNMMSMRGKNYQDGWVKHKYREFTGKWPNGLVYVATPPSKEVINKIKASNIAYARSQEAKLNAV